MVLHLFHVFLSEGSPGLEQSSSCESTELAVKQQEDTSEQKGLNSPEAEFLNQLAWSKFSLAPCLLEDFCLFLVFFVFFFLFNDSKFPLTFVTAVLCLFNLGTANYRG